MNKPKTSKILLIILVVNLFLIQFAAFYKPAKALTTETGTEVFTPTLDADVWQANTLPYATIHDALTGGVENGISVMRLGQAFTGGTYEIWRLLLIFDTSAIPDGYNITSAYLSFYVAGDHSATDFNVTITHNEAAYPHNPPTSSDYYYANYYDTDGGANMTSEISGDGTWFNVTFSSTGLDWISETGNTKLFIRSSKDISSTAPVGVNYVDFSTTEAGEAYAPRLYVTVSGTPYTVLVYGPYNEDGSVYNGNVSLTFNFGNHPTQYNFTDGTDSVADDLNITTSYPMTSLFWNISTTYDYYRVYEISSQFTEIWLYIPDTITSTVNRYAISVSCFGSLTNAYAETLLNVNGSNRVLEQVTFDPVNAMDFWLTQFRQYTFRIVSDQGTFSWTLQADATTSKSYLITADMIQKDHTFPVNITATRSNSTYISVYFDDANETTIWVNTAFLVKSGTAYHEEYSQNDTTYSTTIDWYDAQPTKDYMVNVTYLRNGNLEHWQQLVGVLGNSTSYWTILTDLIPDAPFPIDQLPGLAIVLLIASIASYADSEEGMGIAVIAAAILTYIGWLQIPVTALALATVFVAFTLIHKGKQKERNEA